MKKQSVNTIAKRLFAGSIAAAFFFIVAPNATKANALSDSTVITEKTAAKSNVEYVGSSKENYYFRVQFENAKAEAVQIFVVDENGEYINRIVTKEKRYNKVFLLPKDSDINKLMFVIKSNNLDVKQSFTVQLTTNTIEDVIASKN